MSDDQGGSATTQISYAHHYESDKRDHRSNFKPPGNARPDTKITAAFSIYFKEKNTLQVPEILHSDAVDQKIDEQVHPSADSMDYGEDQIDLIGHLPPFVVV
jgi:hypothetical protein